VHLVAVPFEGSVAYLVGAKNRVKGSSRESAPLKERCAPVLGECRLKGKIVVITGASAGVGRATVREFARHGASLGLLARGREGLEGARREAEASGSQEVAMRPIGSRYWAIAEGYISQYQPMNACILLFRGEPFRLPPSFVLTEGLGHVLLGTSARASLIMEDTTA